MKKIKVFASLLLLVSLIVFAGCNSKSTPSKGKSKNNNTKTTAVVSDEEQIKSLLKNSVSSWVKKDWDTYISCFQSKSPLANSLKEKAKEEMNKTKTTKIDVTSIVVNFKKDKTEIAEATVSKIIYSADNPKGRDHGDLYTLEKENGAWKIKTSKCLPDKKK